jgi:hypothetical protein
MSAPDPPSAPSVPSASSVPSAALVKSLDELASNPSVKRVVNKFEFINGDGSITKIKIVDISLKTRGPREDKMFKDPNIWRLLPRGLAVIYFVTPTEEILIGIVTGLRKFGYDGNGYGEANMSHHVPVAEYYLEKANGSAAHYGFVRAPNGVVFLISGSKSVHIPLRVDHIVEDMAALESEGRYDYALRNATLMYNHLNEMTAENVEHLYGVMMQDADTQQEKRLTICGEGCYLDDTHLVEYPENALYVFAITTLADPRKYGLCAMTIDETMTFCDEFDFKYVGIPNIDGIICISGIDDKEHQLVVRDKIFMTDNSEGSVVYVVDADGRIVGMYKWKNIMYIFWRYVREQIARLPHQDHLRELAFRKISELVHEMIPSADPDAAETNVKMIADLTQKAVRFYNFMRTLFVGADWPKYRPNWVQSFAKFNALSPVEAESYDIYDAAASGQLRIIFRGPPGAGKSTIGWVLMKYLESLGSNVVWINQDAMPGPPRNRNKPFQGIIKATVKRGDVDFVIIDKGHHNNHVLGDTMKSINIADAVPGKCVIIDCFHPGFVDPDFDIGVYIARVCDRKGHLSLGREHAESALKMFHSQFQPITDRAIAGSFLINCNTLELPLDAAINYITEMMAVEKMIPAPMSPDMILGLIAENEIREATLSIAALDVGKAGKSAKAGKAAKPAKGGKGKKGPRVLYWAVQFKPDVYASIKSRISGAFEPGKFDEVSASMVWQPTFHVTLMFMRKKVDDSALKALEGIEIDVTLDSVAYNDGIMACAMILPPDVPCANDQPHITLMRKPEVKAFMSNAMFTAPTEVIKISPLSPIVVRGTIVPVMA